MQETKKSQVAPSALIRPPKRGLNSTEAMAYLGVKRRAWEEIRRRLKPFRKGTSVIYDIRDLDAVFDHLKAPSSVGHGNPDRGGDPDGFVEVSEHESELPSDGRPRSRKGGKAWAARPASTEMPELAAGGSTSVSRALAFIAASKRSRKRRNGSPSNSPT
ncbi:MAG: helix-turn-helix domain-containing protein [Burkholderiaceae bacterium]|nr:helix-turn-helix domain-containing protein [Burkholderiaceae bacterium]